ncbi:FAD-dependent oxidoreductase [Pilimelia columellifera]|uniref:FAD dependent oxidoreductase domain-containing protein n=1 Tax=Pilimelia columellifera subsp. columellifera TaxID=706583 RepID=A0ABN3N4Q9_9ACTN
MSDASVDVLVIGSGICGLTIAITAARRGLSVRCIGDGGPSASVENFGQLHSGAVYAPVLPAVAQACWQHRHRWNDLIGPARAGGTNGLALFHTTDAVNRYRTAWQRLGIDVTEVDAHTTAPNRQAAAAFRLPDHSVHLPTLHASLLDLARASDVRTDNGYEVALHRDPSTALVTVGDVTTRARTVVLATGAATPDLLTHAGIEHTLRTRRIAWARLPHTVPETLTYWLDGDMLAISPDRDCVRVGLPGVAGRYGTAEAEHARLCAALARRGIHPGGLDLRWGAVCEPGQAGPSTLVTDLRDPPPGWTPTANLMVALPGKWTTAWQCADKVVEAIG